MGEKRRNLFLRLRFPSSGSGAEALGKIRYLEVGDKTVSSHSEVTKKNKSCPKFLYLIIYLLQRKTKAFL